MKNIYHFLKAFFYVFICGIVSIAISATTSIVGFASIVYLNKISPITEIPLILLFVCVFISAVALGSWTANSILKN